ncbi:MAG TPA: nucleotidyltransferase family protein [Tepidisphaeraceae bacterium]|jgi:molybdenum cofactor cytidylyltransferase
MTSIGAIILAAGSGSRMGRAKQLLQIDGESLVRRAARAAMDGGCSPVIVVTGAHADLVAPELIDLPVVQAFNSAWATGMGSSIRRGMAALLESDPAVAAVAILLCDQPGLSADVIRNLLSAWPASGKPMAACEYGDTIGPPCCFGAAMFGALGRIGDADGAKKLLLKDRENVLSIPWPDGQLDLDTPEDWRRLCQTDSPPAQ